MTVKARQRPGDNGRRARADTARLTTLRKASRIGKPRGPMAHRWRSASVDHRLRYPNPFWTPWGLAAFRFSDAPQNSDGRRSPPEILNRDPRLGNKSWLGEESDRTIGYPMSYAGGHSTNSCTQQAWRRPFVSQTIPLFPRTSERYLILRRTLSFTAGLCASSRPSASSWAMLPWRRRYGRIDQKRKTLDALMKDHVGHETVTLQPTPS